MPGVRRRSTRLAGYLSPARSGFDALVRAVTDRLMRWRGHPPEPAGVREPRRPRPTLPAAAVALAEPRARVTRRIRLPWDR